MGKRNLFSSADEVSFREIRFGPPIEADHSNNTYDKKYCSNTVSTAKYNAFSFIPRSLFEQFRRVANAYFLLISMLMLIGTYTTFFDSPLTPWSTLIPLVIVLLISMGKEGVEDLKRHYADKQMNARKAHRLNLKKISSQEFSEITWRDVTVGSILCIHNNEEIPADVILLATSEHSCCAYIETANIDGENNLKIKNSVRTGLTEKTSAFSTPSELRGAELLLRCEHPNSAIHHFLGTLVFEQREIPADTSNLLLRGSSLRNTRWALGLVVYTGRETKIVMNSRAAPSKLSSIERSMNNLIYLIFSTQVLISTISLICYVVWKNYNYNQLDYLCYNFEDSYNNVYRLDCEQEDEYNDAGYWFTFFILFNNFLPISLYVTVEVCNYIQAYYIDNDSRMHDALSDTPALARTSNMNGDLGMVEYVFSDKTGTLTENIMQFRRCSVGGVVYGDSPTVTDIPVNHPPSASGHGHSPGHSHGHSHGHGPHIDPMSRALRGQPLQLILEASADPSSLLGSFVLALALCHTVVVEAETGALQSESPDEEALVKAASDLGWAFRARTANTVLLESTRGGFEVLPGPSLQYDLLAVIPFDSTRKRMSVVVRGPDLKILLLCKGADNIILERSIGFAGEVERHSIDAHLDMFANDGLRTLMIASRTLTEGEYHDFSLKWKLAQTSLVNRAEMQQNAATMLEKNLVVLGVTAIEDRLQQGVPETIADLGRAGVKVWVLTGDKVETAINIGHSSKLLGPQMVLIRLTDRGEDAQAVKRRLKLLVSHLNRIAKDDILITRIWKRLQDTIKSALSLNGNGNGNGNSNGNTGSKLDDSTTVKKPGGGGSIDMTDLDASTGGGSVDQLVGKGAKLPGTLSDHRKGNGTTTTTTISVPYSTTSTTTRQVRAVGLDRMTSDHLALVVDGETLIKIFGDHQSERLLLTLAAICKAVIACRVSPEQKRLMVRLVKRGIHPRPITLSIGDGANDVAMIQEAQIGVGISGKEGRQAVNSSDFAIAQFRFLKRLMLVHGRWDYRRICKVVLYSFYKNIVLTLVLFAFTFFSGYSGQSLFDDYIYSGYNFFLALPVVAFGIFDRDVSAESLERYKMLYVSGRERLDMNIPVLGKQLGQAFCDAFFTFFVPYQCYSISGGVWGNGTNGYDSGIWVFGTTVFTCLVISMVLRIVLLTCTWTIPSVCFMGLSIGMYIGFICAYEVQREFFPTVMDIAAEFDAGFRPGDRRDFLGRKLPTAASAATTSPLPVTTGTGTGTGGTSGAAYVTGSGTGDERGSERGSSVSEGGGDTEEEGEEDEDERTESMLRFSPVLGGGMGGKPMKFPLDWPSIKALYGSLAPREKEGLGLESTADPVTSAYNYDHVSSDYGPGAGPAYLYLPYAHISSVLTKAKDVILGSQKGSSSSGSGGGSSKKKKGVSSGASRRVALSSQDELGLRGGHRVEL